MKHIDLTEDEPSVIEILVKHKRKRHEKEFQAPEFTQKKILTKDLNLHVLIFWIIVS